MAQGKGGTTSVTLPLAVSLDARGVAAYATLFTDNKDQQRINSYYEIPRELISGGPTDAILTKRPGVTVDAGTYGDAGQTQYVIGHNPADTWDADPWVFTKDVSNNNKVHNSSTSTTILTDSAYQPRFFDVVTFGTTDYAVIQLQNITDPEATPAQKVYYATVIGTWTIIAAAGSLDFATLSHRGKMIFMDNLAFIADDENRIYQSAVSDLSNWSTSEFIGRTIVQDAPQGLMKVRNHILFFGEDTVEVFTNVGNTTGSILGRVPHSAQRIGLGAVAGGGAGLTGKTEYYTTIGDLGFFVGRYGGTSTEHSLIMYNGSRFEKISRPIEDKILSSTEVYSVNRVSFGGKPGVGIQLTLPTASTQRWLMYFPDINDFFLWETTVYSPVNNGKYYAGIINTQKLYTFGTTNNWQDAGTNYTMTTQFRLPLLDTKWRSMPVCGVIADSTTTTSNLGVSYSDDDGQNWSTARNINLNSRRKELTGLGGFRERSFRLTHTDSNECRLRGFYFTTTVPSY